MVHSKNTAFFASSALLVASSALSLGAAPAQAATLTVPAQPGDVVLLADGTYTGPGNVNLDFGCTFNGNVASSGGGVYDSSSSDSFVNCVFDGNFGIVGGGFYGNAALTNCTFTGNYSVSGGAVSTSKAFTNCILFGDTNAPEIDTTTFGPPSVTYCDVQGTFAGTGNTSADPQFARAPSNLLASTPADYGDLPCGSRPRRA